MNQSYGTGHRRVASIIVTLETFEIIAGVIVEQVQINRRSEWRDDEVRCRMVFREIISFVENACSPVD